MSVDADFGASKLVGVSDTAGTLIYGYRCVDVLGIDPMPGVLRISMVHYNTLDEVQRLTAALEEIAWVTTR